MVRRRACLLLAATVALPAALAACVARDDQPRPYLTGAGRPPGESGLSTTAPAGRTVALLAPLTGANAERGDQLVKAAQLALSEPGSPALDVHDTASTPAGAAAAAQAAIAAGAGIIIGPLSAAETAAVAGPATTAGVPVLAFTNDPAQAKPGVWTLGITPVQQVSRLMASATAQGKTRFAAVLPHGDFGQAMAAALTKATSAAGLAAPDIHFHDDGNAAIAETMKDVSDYADRRGPVDAKIKAARLRHDAEGRKAVADLSREGVPPAPFDALLLADTGEKLAWLSTFLSYYDIDSPPVQIMGPLQWESPAARAGASIGGAWFAAPDPAARAGFDQAYSAKYGAPAPGLADLAYDAASIARTLAQGGGYSVAGLARPEGFPGVDGLVALQPDGSVRRGLALFTVQHGGAVLTEPAPQTLAAAAF
jgi:hypothetical protein